MPDQLHLYGVTTQAREGIETCMLASVLSDLPVTTQAREGIETYT